jgi:broad specificity phosphatase PhoE
MNKIVPDLLLIRTAATEIDLQGRLCGQLDVPLAEEGLSQARTTARDLADSKIKLIFRAPCMAAMQTSELLAAKWGARVKVDKALRNIDYGLWHGRTLSELRTNQPRVFRSWMEHPEAICPPNGEPIQLVCERVEAFLKKIQRKYPTTKIAIVASAPIISILAALCGSGELSENWSNQQADGAWISLVAQPAIMSNLDARVPAVVRLSS